MIIFLTSDPGTTYVEGQTGLRKDNGFVTNLREHLYRNTKVLIIASDPMDDEMNKSNVEFIKESFEISRIHVESIDVCDDKHRDLAKKLSEYDFILLSGGHVPTQSKFFKEIDLYNEIRKFDGVLMGISAGSMNCAETVYAVPELEGESIDPEYERFISGLGLTNLKLIPHFQWLKTVTLDGKNMIEDIALGDSHGQRFIGIVDGAYVLIEGGVQILYGEGYELKDGKITKICNSDEGIVLE